MREKKAVPNFGAAFYFGLIAIIIFHKLAALARGYIDS